MGLTQKEDKPFVSDKKMKHEKISQVVRESKKQIWYVKLVIINCLKITDFFVPINAVLPDLTAVYH